MYSIWLDIKTRSRRDFAKWPKNASRKRSDLSGVKRRSGPIRQLLSKPLQEKSKYRLFRHDIRP
jgi:hypothetical protein